MPIANDYAILSDDGKTLILPPDAQNCMNISVSTHPHLRIVHKAAKFWSNANVKLFNALSLLMLETYCRTAKLCL
jgi:hypothetical protein